MEEYLNEFRKSWEPVMIATMIAIEAMIKVEQKEYHLDEIKIGSNVKMKKIKKLNDRT